MAEKKVWKLYTKGIAMTEVRNQAAPVAPVVGIEALRVYTTARKQELYRADAIIHAAHKSMDDHGARIRSLAKLAEQPHSIKDGYTLEKMLLAEKAAALAATQSVEDVKLRISRDAFDELAEWGKKPFTLGRPQGVFLHKIIEAQRAKEVAALPATASRLNQIGAVEATVMVVEHDWAAALAGAHDYDLGDYRLPYDETFFEFQVSGKSVGLLCRQETGERFVYIRAGRAEWVILRDGDAEKVDGRASLFGMLEAQVRAISILLEAEATVTETVRAPDRLNHAREKSGKPPLKDHHVIRLARRERPAALPEDHEHTPGTRHRLHFVRGHWRHYPTHKTWIKWHLRGDPDLGFIDKHYRL